MKAKNISKKALYKITKTYIKIKLTIENRKIKAHLKY